MHKICFGSGAEGPFSTCNAGDTWPVGTVEEAPAQQGCWGQLSCVLPARLHQLLWSQDSNPSLVPVPDISFTSFVSGFRSKFSGRYVEAWLVLQGSCPAALIQSASLVGLAGCEHCKGLGGNVWGIQVIALSPFSLCEGSGRLGQRTGPSHNTSDADASKYNTEVEGLLCRGCSPLLTLLQHRQLMRDDPSSCKIACAGSVDKEQETD